MRIVPRFPLGYRSRLVLGHLFILCYTHPPGLRARVGSSIGINAVAVSLCVISHFPDRFYHEAHTHVRVPLFAFGHCRQATSCRAWHKLRLCIGMHMMEPLGRPNISYRCMQSNQTTENPKKIIAAFPTPTEVTYCFQPERPANPRTSFPDARTHHKCAQYRNKRLQGRLQFK